MNAYTQDKGSLKVTKDLKGAPEGTDGKEFQVTIKNAEGKYVSADGSLGDDEVKLTVSKNKVLEIKDLPIGTYTVTELEDGRAIESYTFDADGSTVEATGNVTKDGTAEVALVNAYKAAKTEATVVKVWNDSNNSGNTRPSELRVTLLADGVEKLTVTLPDPVTGWTKQVTNLDKYTKDGKEIKYTWSEAVPAGYRLTNTETKGTVTTLTNTLTERREEFTEATIIKIWNDNNNAGNVRPVSLVVTLMADGSPIQSVTLSAANGWSYTRTGLPMYRDGRAIRYSWSEALPAGYTLTSYVNNGTITSLTNSHQEEFQSTVLGAQRGQVLGANRAKTGDESDLLLWMTLMMASAAGLLAAFKKRKRA